jgi:very-short-patch-repair endonuclease
MRRAMTTPERRLRAALRLDALGTKARRQVPLGPFIADFYIPAAKLVVEVDGVTHDGPAADAVRDDWLFTRGVLVSRFANDDVMRNLDGVLSRITALVAGRLSAPCQPAASDAARP